MSTLLCRFHVGCYANDPQSFCDAIKFAKTLFEVGHSMGHPMQFLDIGGGFHGIDEDAKIPFSKVNTDLLRERPSPIQTNSPKIEKFYI